MNSIFTDTISNTIIITVFVLVMMLIIEYVNVITRGKWSKPLQRSGSFQVFLSAILGVIPGCLGTYAVVSMYTHNILGFGALVAAMVATFGDEAFILFSILPDTAIKLVLITFIVAVATGYITHLIFRDRLNFSKHQMHFELHSNNTGDYQCYEPHKLKEHFRHISYPRAILVLALIAFITGIFTGLIAHDHDSLILNMQSQSDVHEEHGFNWLGMTLVLTSFVALFIVSVSSNHFLKEHLWGHVIKKHFLKIFLWTLGALIIIHFSMKFMDVSDWIRENHLFILLLALIIGIIPESGPHILFISLYATNTIPFSILLASSIVQDGHGALPLFAESRIRFLQVKAVNILIGFLAGMAGYLTGW